MVYLIPESNIPREDNMSVVDLMLLGFLHDKPMNAYEIKKEVESKNLVWWIKMSSPSIYRNISALSDKGYIDGETVREGEMPEKTIYTINQKGRAYFSQLMEQYANNPPKIYLDFTATISNLNHVDSETGQRILDNLYHTFRETQKILAAIENSYDRYQAKVVTQLNQQMYDLFCNWIAKFKEEFYGTSITENEGQEL